MNLRKSLNFFLFFFLVFFLSGTRVFAGENSFITIVNPVRGSEFSQPKNQDIVGIEYQKNLLEETGLKATWLLRSDTFNSSTVFSKLLRSPSTSSGLTQYSDVTSEKFDSLSPSVRWTSDFSASRNKDFAGHEFGIFLEILPSLAKDAGVNYPQGGIFWHDANKIFLSGYKLEERIKLIDKVFSEFKDAFGYYPKSVGAWHVDAYSAEYMKQRYGVTGVLICADQFGTDGYQIWGGWWGVPYYPSKYNILAPAQTLKNKLDLVIFWWAARDPKLGYGGSVSESTYSVQVNDYQSHGLGIDYFKSLLDIYLNDGRNQFGQITIGLENDNDWEKIGNGFDIQVQEVAERAKEGEIQVLTMSEFSDWYRSKFKSLSPEHQIGEWKMSPVLRLETAGERNKKILRDLRIYNEKWPEANLLTANPWETLSLNNPYKIDTVRFGNSAVKTDSEINIANLVKRFGSQKIPFEGNNLLFLLFYSFILLLLIYFLKNNLPLLVLVVVGSVSLSLPVIKSGLVYPFGMGFWGPNGHDGIWHIALINQLVKFSLNNPVFSGMKLTNYHFGFDLFVAVLSRLTGIIPVRLYFQILPPLISVGIGLLTFKFVEKWTLSKSRAWWASFFVYFGGSWGWLLGKGESTFWANQAISTLINPPYALSLIILLFGLIQFLDYLKKPKLKNLIIISLLFGLLIQIKVYAGILVLGSLACLLLVSLILYRIKVREILKLFLGTFLVALVVFLPFNLKASSLLVFSPLWFPRTMIAYADRLGWFKLENARLAYFHSGKWLRWLLAEGLALTIFIFGNLGTRAVGFLYGGFLGRMKRRVSVIEIFLFCGLLISLTLPLLFIQKGNSWNTIQFFYYFQFLTAIFAGVVIGGFFEKLGKCRIVICFTIVLLAVLTLPTTVSTLKNDYLPSRAPSRISIEELEALGFLKKQPPGNILTYPFNPEWKNKFSEPRPLYAYETTAYISALSGKETFLADEMNLEITGFAWQPRREDSLRFFLTNDTSWANNFLQTNNIKFIYLVKGQKMNLGLGDINGEKIFENGEVTIHRVNNVK